VRRVLITGGAGFIGSNLADRLLAEGLEVVVYDNFATGQRRFIEGVEAAERGEVAEGDVLDGPALRGAMAGCDTVFHLAANADVRYGLEDPSRDFEQNTVGTFTVLEAMRAAGPRRIVFASSGSVYGEPEVAPTPEDAPFPVQTSLYAASKLAGEGMIQAYAEGYGFTGVILRFVSVLGERYTAHLGLTPRIEYTGGTRGWIGDSPLIHLDCSRLRALGWRPRLTIAEAVTRTLDWFDANDWVFAARVVR
jgi:UDP-glucose 4-epimerase